ncbi:hypothetical protein Mapa_007708 [Marchantia paleacea]|nr:hypothetical protein Mapa_007708 [Marchantia paleacea]
MNPTALLKNPPQNSLCSTRDSIDRVTTQCSSTLVSLPQIRSACSFLLLPLILILPIIIIIIILTSKRVTYLFFGRDLGPVPLLLTLSTEIVDLLLGRSRHVLRGMHICSLRSTD